MRVEAVVGECEASFDCLDKMQLVKQAEYGAGWKIQDGSIEHYSR